jgi:phage shock protein PspC (stress-responsive transcriptional regulator)
MSDREHATRRLVRRTDDKVIAGVCSGLADHFGVDPIVIRLGFVALALTGGGILAYLAAWALIPPVTGPGGLGTSAAPKLGTALLVVAGAITATATAGFVVSAVLPLSPFDQLSPEPIGLAAALVIAGVLLLRAPERPRRATSAEEGAASADAPEPAVSLPARPPRERSGLTPLTLAAALLAGGGTAVCANAGWVTLDVGQITALSLVVVGAGLVLGAWIGRGRLLILVGVLMIPFVLVASLVDLRPSGSVGSNYVTLTEAGELEDMRVLAGQVTLDLTEYPFAEGTERARLSVGAGSMNVHVPSDVYVVVDATVGGGETYVLDRYGEGFGFDVVVHEEAGPENAKKRLELQMEAGFGTLGVYRVRTGPPDRRRQSVDRPREKDRDRPREKAADPPREKDGDRPAGTKKGRRR